MNYTNYINAARDVSRILEREKHMKCEFIIMNDEYYENLACPEFSKDNRGNVLCVGNWYVIVHCSNGHLYYVNVTCDSVLAMCEEVFFFVQRK